MSLNKLLSGSDARVAISGGYLYIYYDDSLLSIISIPTPNLLADNNEQSRVENYDNFTDPVGNEYDVTIYSQKYGIDWDVEPIAKDDDAIKKLRFEVKLNEH